MAFCNHLPFASSVALNISGKDAEVAAHPPSASMVPLGTLVPVPLESGGPGPPSLHQPRASQSSASLLLPDSEKVPYKHDEILFHSIQNNRYKMGVSFSIFFFLERMVFQLLGYTVALFLQHHELYIMINK